MEFELTEKFAVRLLHGGHISYYVIVVPNGKQVSDFSNLRQVLLSGGRVFGGKGIRTQSKMK